MAYFPTHVQWKTTHRRRVTQMFQWVKLGGVSLDEFLACRSNLAINRQTRMLADLAEVVVIQSCLTPNTEQTCLKVPKGI